MDVGDRLEEVSLETAGGEAVLLSHYLDRIRVVQLLRYYG